MTQQKERRELLQKFFVLEEVEDSVVSAWDYFIDVQQAHIEMNAGLVSRRDWDNVQRKFERYMKKNKLTILDEDNGLKAHELAITKAGEGKDKIKVVHSSDVWLLAGFEAVCLALVADEPDKTEVFPDAVIDFLGDPDVHEWLKERLIEKNKEAGERLLKAILEDRPTELNAHSLLVEFYERESRFSDAETEFRRILDETDDELVWANYGHFLEMRGRYEDAFVAFKNALVICERVGEEELVEEVRRNISIVERMKNLEGEKARTAREYQEAVWLIGDIRVFSEKMMDSEITKAQEEYIKEKDIEKIELEDSFDFMYWFLFQRELPNGKVPGMVYAEEKGLSEATKARLEGLGSPVEGFFEIAAVDYASFKLEVKDMITGNEYELMGTFSLMKEGQTFSGYIYPWGNFYFTAGTMARHTDEYRETLKRLIGEVKTGKIFEEAQKTVKMLHDAFITYFGIEDPTFKSKTECEAVFNKFSNWMLFEYESEEERKTFSEIYEEKHGQKPEPEKADLPDTFNGVDDIALLCDFEHGISAVRYYGLVKRVFETGAIDEIKAKNENPKELLMSVESFVIWRLVHGNERNAVKVFNDVFDAGLDEDASEDEIVEFWGTVEKKV